MCNFCRRVSQLISGLKKFAGRLSGRPDGTLTITLSTGHGGVCQRLVVNDIRVMGSVELMYLSNGGVARGRQIRVIFNVHPGLGMVGGGLRQLAGTIGCASVTSV